VSKIGIPRKEDGVNGPIGFFGGMQGATPKYAKNTGAIHDDFRGSMARFFINAGRDSSVMAVASLPDGYESLEPAVKHLYGNGYIDFLLQNVQTGLNEKVEVTENLAGGFVAYYFGTSPQVLQCSGVLINSMQDDQVVSMVRLYAEILRGTKLAEHGETLRLRYDSFMYTGTVNGLQWSLAAENELYCPFSFTFLVKKRLEIPSTYSVSTSVTPLSELERGTVDVVGPALVPQKNTATAPPVKTVPAAKDGPPPAASREGIEAAKAKMEEQRAAQQPAFGPPAPRPGFEWDPYSQLWFPAPPPRKDLPAKP
jgi:hypothetical protein